MASIADFEAYDSSRRLQDFARSFGGDIDQLENRMWRFLGKLQAPAP
jgi:hypothetical protein